MKSVSKKKGICAYCGDEGEITDDHIPPRNIFPKPHDGLIKVPCCIPCHEDTSKDDEYFMIYIYFAEGADKHPLFREVADKVIRSFKRDKAKAFSRVILSNIEDIEWDSDPRGFRRGQAIYSSDQDRIVNVLDRIVRGLFFRKNEKIIPEDHVLKIKPADEKLRNEICKYPQTQQEDIKNGTFRYWLFEPNEENTSSFWLMCFHNSTWFLGSIRPTKNGNISIKETEGSLNGN